MVDFYCVDLAKLGLHFPEFSSLRNSQLAWASRDIRPEIWRWQWSGSYLLSAWGRSCRARGDVATRHLLLLAGSPSGTWQPRAPDSPALSAAPATPSDSLTFGPGAHLAPWWGAPASLIGHPCRWSWKFGGSESLTWVSVIQACPGFSLLSPSCHLFSQLAALLTPGSSTRHKKQKSLPFTMEPALTIMWSKIPKMTEDVCKYIFFNLQSMFCIVLSPCYNIQWCFPPSLNILEDYAFTLHDSSIGQPPHIGWLSDFWLLRETKPLCPFITAFFLQYFKNSAPVPPGLRCFW